MVIIQKNMLKIMSLMLVALTFAGESKADSEIFENVQVGNTNVVVGDNFAPRQYPAARPYPGPVQPGDQFYDYLNQRELKVAPTGAVMPATEPGPLTKATTYNTEFKPYYNSKSDRIKYELQNKHYQGEQISTDSPTVTPSWLDRMTTYNQEQRRPWNPYDSKVKKAPANVYYNGKLAREENKHYLQDNLKPVPYMYGSASLVLRKEQQEKSFELPKEMNLDRIVNPDSAFRNEEDMNFVASNSSYAQPMGGYASISDRYNMNQQDCIPQKGMIVTDPDSIMNEYYETYATNDDYTFHSNVMIGSPKRTQTQVVTAIKSPKAAWNEKLQGRQDLARPGDFDYKKARENTVEAYRVGDAGYGSGFSSGNAIQIRQPVAPAVQNGDSQSFYIENGDAPYRGEKGDAPRGMNKPDNYQVEKGDTLSQISEKEKIYGNWTLWPLIYDANRNQVQDPDLINPGQNLDIPRDYSNQEADHASYRARNKETPISLYDGQ